MHPQAVIDDLARKLIEERIARSLQAHRAAGLRARRDCPLERLARWIKAGHRRPFRTAELSR